MPASFKWNKDIAGLFADRQSGKTTLTLDLLKAIRSSVPDAKIIVLNSNYEESYSKLATINVKPKFYDTNTLDQFILLLRKNVNALGVIDDIDLYTPQYSKHLIPLAVNGAHQNLGLVILSRRVIGLPKTFIQCMKLIYLAQPSVPEDKDYIADLWGSGILSKCEQLPQFQFLKFDKYSKQDTSIVESGRGL